MVKMKKQYLINKYALILLLITFLYFEKADAYSFLGQIFHKESEINKENMLTNDKNTIDRELQKAGESKIIFHVISHSHQDVGWLQTPEDYYDQYVKQIITSVLESLEKNKYRKFNQAEIYFFKRWWDEQDQTTKERMRQLVKDGRFSFVNGGWVASDEACPLFTDLLQNIKTGHEFLKQEFGIIPEIAWHADAFGHSSEVAKIFSLIGYKGLFMGRLSAQHKSQLQETNNMQFYWSPEFQGEQKSYRSQKGIYSHFFYKTYHPPCDIQLHSINVNDIEQLINNQLQEYAKGYKTKNLIMNFGDDFVYTSAGEIFEFIENTTMKSAKKQWMKRQHLRLTLEIFSHYICSLKVPLGMGTIQPDLIKKST
ncbi:lysosomal alpha-mannosidase [Stylonychia lemnae]|uniref:Lysosomal alpha-mannosidase n=1 Tax=Stylonychia lemnae TaxID=5949 RepID=A0A078APC4_STYLE|nr:lysosomal alpha-mannosidase [Stylonychia lemnae]|eukprot:CDW82808.1 lysosomal alpha-mannosidase [Stylonychia lemnae]